MHEMSMVQGLASSVSVAPTNSHSSSEARDIGQVAAVPVAPEPAYCGSYEPETFVVSNPGSVTDDVGTLEASRSIEDTFGQFDSHSNLFEMHTNGESDFPARMNSMDAILRPSVGVLSSTESGRCIVSGLASYELSVSSPSGRVTSIDGLTDDRMTGSDTLVRSTLMPPPPESADPIINFPKPFLAQLEEDPSGALDTLLDEVNVAEKRSSLEQPAHEPINYPSDTAELDDPRMEKLVEEVERQNALFREQQLQNEEPKPDLQIQTRKGNWASIAAKATPVILAVAFAIGISAIGGPAGASTQWASFSTKVAAYCSTNAKSLLSLFTLTTSLYLQLSGVPTVLQIAKDKNTGSLSAIPYAAMIANCSVWAVFGLMYNSMACFIPNITGLIFGITYLAIFAANTKEDMSKIYAGVGIILTGLAAAVTLFGHAAGPAIGQFGSVFCFILMASPLATVRTVIKTKTTASMPFPMVLGTLLDSLSWCLLGLIILKEPALYLPNIGGLGAAAVQLGLFAVYGFGDKPKEQAQSKSMVFAPTPAY